MYWQPVIRTKELLRLHQETYRIFWKWSDSAVDYVMLHGKLWTIFGWTVHTGTNPNPRFLLNVLMQGNGSEMLRLVCCMVSEAGIHICAPVHDAILIEATLDKLNQVIEKTKAIMAEASAIVLAGFRLSSDAEVIRYPDRYMDERGTKMWQTVNSILTDLESSTRSPVPTLPVHEQTLTCPSAHTVPSYYLVRSLK